MENTTPIQPKRSCPRYTVSNLTCLRARMDRNSAAEKILTIGAGGCGFVGFDRFWEKVESKRVFSSFELTLDTKIGPITVQGNIVYMKPMMLNNRSVYYFGVQFLPDDAHRIEPLLEVLEDLSRKGQIPASA